MPSGTKSCQSSGCNKQYTVGRPGPNLATHLRNNGSHQQPVATVPRQDRVVVAKK